jgi:hypothetical protein
MKAMKARVSADRERAMALSRRRDDNSGVHH